MKAILLMLGALSAAIIFVGCGTAVGRATGVESEKSSIATADSSAPQNAGVDEDRVRMIIQEELQKYDSSKPKNEPPLGPSMMQSGMMQEMKTQLDALQLPDQNAPAVDEEMVRALVSDEIEKSRPMFEAMVVEEITDSQFQVEELGLMLQELGAHLEAIRELEPILSDIPGLNSSVEGLQQSIIDAERVIGAIEQSNDDFQTSIQSQHDLFQEYMGRNIIHLSVQLEGLISNQNPVAATKALSCLADIECLASLDTLTSHAENEFRESDPAEMNNLYTRLNSDGWDLDVLSEDHRYAVVYHRYLTQGMGTLQEVSCYISPDCVGQINRIVELAYELEENVENEEVSRELITEIDEIDTYLGEEFFYDWEYGDRGIFRGQSGINLKILFSPIHEDIILRTHDLYIGGVRNLFRMIGGVD